MTSTAIDYALSKGLPKKTKTICPECGKILEGTLYEKDGKVYIDKECPEHGVFSDIYWSDAEMFLKAEEFALDGIGLQNPCDPTLAEGENVHIMIDDQRVDMLSCTALANIDLTNRCNMNCPICFANANQQGYVYEPSFDEVVAMLTTLRSEKPIRCTAVQFSGGEPTVYPRLVDVIKKAKEMGFAQVQIATNGIEFAKHPELLQACKDAGLNTIYLSFDGVTEDVYLQARDRKMFNVKLKVLENLRAMERRPSVVLVPTCVKGVNDHQIGDIVKFAFDNSDVVRGINFQPVAFTGRITREEVSSGRFTLPDLVRCVDEQTGYAKKNDWYPVPVVAPISKFASIIMGENKVTFTTHPHCGIATYLFQDDKGNVVPMPRFIDVKTFSQALNKIANKADDSKFKKFYLLKVVSLLNKCLDESKMPEGLSKKKIIELMKNVMSDKSKATLATFSWKMMFIGGMHFQDSFNYDVERVRRCAVHYVTPDQRVIPFCAYNGGPEYRKEVEEKFSMPLAEWKERNKEEAKALEEAMIVPEDQRPDA
jgi:7,8-dihydro-6-hydroxymethylpterin dimethyltransferase